jgi:hypothetical protein
MEVDWAQAFVNYGNYGHNSNFGTIGSPGGFAGLPGPGGIGGGYSGPLSINIGAPQAKNSSPQTQNGAPQTFSARTLYGLPQGRHGTPPPPYPNPAISSPFYAPQYQYSPNNQFMPQFAPQANVPIMLNGKGKPRRPRSPPIPLVPWVPWVPPYPPYPPDPYPPDLYIWPPWDPSDPLDPRDHGGGPRGFGPPRRGRRRSWPDNYLLPRDLYNTCNACDGTPSGWSPPYSWPSSRCLDCGSV